MFGTGLEQTVLFQTFLLLSAIQTLAHFHLRLLIKGKSSSNNIIFFFEITLVLEMINANDLSQT
jgi:hypothetical protein